jgi:hypothetical protein
MTFVSIKYTGGFFVLDAFEIGIFADVGHSCDNLGKGSLARFYQSLGENFSMFRLSADAAASSARFERLNEFSSTFLTMRLAIAPPKDDK